MFNFQKNILNESLQSSILYNEILNEPGGFFKYQFAPNITIHTSSLTLKEEKNRTKVQALLQVIEYIRRILRETFNTTNYPTSTYYYKILNTLSLDKIKKLNTLYNAQARIFIKLATHIFDKPNPQIFNYIIKGQYKTADLYNITDLNFKKYTYEELRKRKQDFLLEIADSSKYIFWFNGDSKELQAITKGNTIYFYGVNVQGGQAGTFPKYEMEQFRDRMQKEKLLDTEHTRTDILSDGTEIKWINIKFNTYNLIPDILYINKRVKKSNSKHYTIGNPFTSSSNIQKMAGWNKNGYVIIYTPNEFYKDENNKYVSYEIDSIGQKNTPTAAYLNGYNDWKIRNYKSVEKHNDFVSSTTFNKYKWRKDIYGNVIAYAPDTYNYIYSIDPETGKGIQTRVSNDRPYYDQLYAYYKDKNKRRYNLEKTTVKSKLIIKKYNKLINDLLVDYLKPISEIIEKFKIVYQQTKETTILSIIYNQAMPVYNGLLNELALIKYNVELLEKECLNTESKPTESYLNTLMNNIDMYEKEFHSYIKEFNLFKEQYYKKYFN